MDALMCKLNYWGERGLIMALVHDIDDEKLPGWKKFLRCLKLAQEQRSGLPDPDRLISVWAVVEPDFGNKGFGHPDLVLKLTFEGRSPFVLFVEAKFTSFQRAARRDRHQDGFNSSINGQIELNHRLALALLHFQESAMRLIEPDWVVSTEDYDTAIPDSPRYVRKPLVLRGLAGFLGRLPLDHYFHVAITNDTQNPVPNLADIIQPRIFVDGNRLGWTESRDRLFWSSWQCLRDASKTWRRFHEALEAMKLVPEQAVERIAYRATNKGVSLVQFRQKQQYIYMSWQGQSYRLRDYNGHGRIDRPHKSPLTEIEPDIVHELTVPGLLRKPYSDSSHWNNLTTFVNFVGRLPEPATNGRWT